MIKVFFKSIFIGICAIIPGVSGSVIAISLGIYDKFIDSIVSISKLKANKTFIIIVIIGILLGFYSTSTIIIKVIKYKTLVSYILVGIISSDIPFLIKKTLYNGENKIKIFPFIISFISSLLFNYISLNNITSFNITFKYFLGGILFSFGKVFPGISSSFFLLCLGIYQDIIILILNPFLFFYNFSKYFPFIVGLIIGLLIFINLLSYLLNNKYNFFYSMLIGFVLSSVFIMLPKFSLNLQNIIGIILMMVFFVLFLYIKKKKEL